MSPILLIAIVGGGIYLGMTGRGHVLITVPLAIALLSACQYAMMVADVRRVSDLDQREFQQPSSGHEYVVTDWDSKSCAVLCPEILTLSPYQAVSESRYYDNWTTFKLLSGPACLDAENRKSYFSFLSEGYAGRCAAAETQPIGDNALVVKFHYRRGSGSSSRSVPAEIPNSFEGEIFELFERIDGKERLLARWIEGHIRPVSYWFGLVGLRGMKVGQRFERHEFYSAALEVSFVEPHFSGDSDLEQVFRELEVFLVDPEFAGKALNALGSLSEWKGDDQQQMIARYVAGLLNSGQPDKILAGFRIAIKAQDFDPESVKDRIVQLFDHENPDVVAAALSAAFKLSEEDRIGLSAKFAEMARSPTLAKLDSPVLPTLLGHMRHVDMFSEDTRLQAKQLLGQPGALSGAQRVAFLAIVANGDPAFRAEAGSIALSTDISELRDMVVIIDDIGWRNISGLRRDDWTDSEMKELVARAAQLPGDQLQTYINALRRHDAFDGYRDEAAEIASDYLERAKSAPNPDPKSIRALERFTASLD
jgi:hypothetical protein